MKQKESRDQHPAPLYLDWFQTLNGAGRRREGSASLGKSVIQCHMSGCQSDKNHNIKHTKDTCEVYADGVASVSSTSGAVVYVSVCLIEGDVPDAV